jgi:hypothetical protein
MEGIIDTVLNCQLLILENNPNNDFQISKTIMAINSPTLNKIVWKLFYINIVHCYIFGENFINFGLLVSKWRRNK